MDVTYENWKKEISLWQTFSSPDKKKQAIALCSSLEGKAREVGPELPIENIDADDGFCKITSHLDKLYLKDKLQTSLRDFLQQSHMTWLFQMEDKFLNNASTSDHIRNQFMQL